MPSPTTVRARRTPRATSTGTANGSLFELPAGNAATTLQLGVRVAASRQQRRSASDFDSTSLGRTTGTPRSTSTCPISRRNRDFSALGNLTLNANAELDQLSDFGR